MPSTASHTGCHHTVATTVLHASISNLIKYGEDIKPGMIMGVSAQRRYQLSEAQADSAEGPFQKLAEVRARPTPWVQYCVDWATHLAVDRINFE